MDQNMEESEDIQLWNPKNKKRFFDNDNQNNDEPEEEQYKKDINNTIETNKYDEKNEDEIIEEDRLSFLENEDEIEERIVINPLNIKENNSVHQQRYYAKNKDKVKNAKREYYESNKEKIIEQKRLYYLKNKEKIAERQKIYREKKKQDEQNSSKMKSEQN